MLRHIDFHS